MSVQVGVRVRPFNKREEQLKSRLCVQMDGKTTTVIDNEGQTKSFHYDYSFWSHDGFRVDEEGYSHPIDDKYADQKKVYDLIGSSILTNAWEGYNCCLFAYGQTGSGKSYSMIGYGANKGLIPIVCNSIFEKINNNQDGTRSFEVKVSMLEIYNQAVRDLLSKSKKQDLKICQHKTLGVYVDGLEKHGVDSYDKIQKKIQQGSNNRSIASTLMNQSSSRSHTIVSINFVQKIQISMEQTSVKYSMIHLVDLAGSECVAKTGVDSKDRLRETAKINQSLTTLGRVIQILAENCNKKQKDKLFVPYRDSKLTFILRNALGGNSCTAMICAISPSDDNYEETISTLRYASRAKKIQNKAIVNESDVDKLIRILREQNQMLKKMLQEAKTNKTAINEQIISNINETKKLIDIAADTQDSRKSKAQKELFEDISQQKFLQGIDDNNNSFSTSNDSSYSQWTPIKGVNQNLPYITNISEDQLLSFRIKYSCQRLIIGSKKGNPKPDVILTSPGIQPNHAFISYDSQAKKCFLELLDENAINFTFLNGRPLTTHSKEQLFNLDRIIFGTGCNFLFIFKQSSARNSNLKLQDIDSEYVINEMQLFLAQKNSQNNDEQQQLRKKILNEIEQDFKFAKKQKQQQMKKQIQQRQKDYNNRLKQLQQIKQKQAFNLLQQLQARKKQSQRLQKQKALIRQQVQKIIQQTKQRSKRQQMQKKQLQSTKQILALKQRQIRDLQNKMLVISAQTQIKQAIAKMQIQKQQQQMKRQLQIQKIMCQNANIISQYQLQLNKRIRNAKQIKDLLIRKQKNQLHKQLTQLVPQVQTFNLMAKEMNKKLQCGLSIDYKYISQAEIIQVVKNNTYKSKLKILIHIINRDQGRSYYWDTQTFKNRYNLSKQYFQNYIKQSNNFKYNQQEDPYWDPQKFQTVAYTHLALEFLLFNISYSGNIAIINHSRKIGKISAKLYQTDRTGTQNLSIDEKGYKNEYRLINPYDYVEKTIYFIIELSQIDLHEGQLQQYDQMKISYQIIDNYRVHQYSSQVIPKDKISQFKYRKFHCIRQINQKTVLYYLQKPLPINIQVILTVAQLDQLTHRSSFTSVSNAKSSFYMEQSASQISSQLDVSQFVEVSPPRKSIKIANTNSSSSKKPANTGVLYENTDLLKRVQLEYQKKKRQSLNTQSINMKKKDGRNSVAFEQINGKNPKQCQIY